MSIITYGINHKTAPITIREKMAFSSHSITGALHNLLRHEAVNEAVILSTCNRTELYCATEDVNAITSWIRHTQPANAAEITKHSYHYQQRDAIMHMMRVACGLDSMVLGEPQILGQMKQAYALACDAGTVGQQLKQLFPAIFATSKQIRASTAIGKHPVSMAYAAISLAKQIFSSIQSTTVLLIGTGDIMEVVANHLKNLKVKKIIVASRTLEKAAELSIPLQGHAIRIGDIPIYIKECDIVISATASQLPILGKGMIESVQKHKKHRPMLMVDLALPRDIEPEVGELEDIYLYNIDDLQTIIQQNLDNRTSAAKQAEAIIALQVEHYLRQMRVLNASDLIARYREQLQTINNEELTKALSQLQNGQSPQAVLNNFAHQIINKIMHAPTVKLREAAYHDQLDVLMLVKQFYDL